MKTKTINLYSLDELSKEAQEQAHAEWIKNNDYSFLNDCLAELLHELLEENNIKDLSTTSTQVLYSLSNNQGDGAMFQGSFQWEEQTISIEHSGRYYHSYSKEITFDDFVGEDKENEEEIIAGKFETIYQSICKKLEKYGYDWIECEDSFESFQSACEANDYTFLSTGEMEN